MDIEEFRSFCLSFPDTHEGMPFQGFFKNSRSILVFYVGKKMFCFFDIDRYDFCTIKCDPEETEKLRQLEGIEKPFNLSEKHWISVSLTGIVSEEMLKDLVEKSYMLVAASLKKRIN
ncbi:MAG: MmcQ/YjbR family DNA-binding protein [Flavobacterium sp.]|nr:MAG: MmcQ/YjbR family DNA-binding protein [Flavobacterium sp.]